jgi:heme-degrading monooxygenase HmoA
MISVWESEEAMERFFETRLPRAMAEVGLDGERHTRSSFEIYKQAVAGAEPAPAH